RKVAAAQHLANLRALRRGDVAPCCGPRRRIAGEEVEIRRQFLSDDNGERLLAMLSGLGDEIDSAENHRAPGEEGNCAHELAAHPPALPRGVSRGAYRSSPPPAIRPHRARSSLSEEGSGRRNMPNTAKRALSIAVETTLANAS